MNPGTSRSGGQPEVDVGTIVALVIAACSLAVASWGLRQRNNDTYTASLEHQVEALKVDMRDGSAEYDRKLAELKEVQMAMVRDLDDCKRSRAIYEDKNFQLMQEIYEMRKQLDAMRRG